MNIGQFKQNASDMFLGGIQTAMLYLALGLRPAQSTNSAAPKYDVMVHSRSGQFLPIDGQGENTATNGSGFKCSSWSCRDYGLASAVGDRTAAIFRSTLRQAPAFS